MQWVCTYKEPKLETKHMLLIAQNYSSQSSCTICYAIKKKQFLRSQGNYNSNKF